MQVNDFAFPCFFLSGDPLQCHLKAPPIKKFSDGKWCWSPESELVATDNLAYHQVSQLIMGNMCGKKPVTVDRLEWSDVYTI